MKLIPILQRARRALASADGGRSVRAVLLACLAGFGASATLRSDVFTVTKTVDSADGVCDGDCSLREAVMASNDSPSVVDTIVLGPGPYNLTILPGRYDEGTGDLDVTASVDLVPMGGIGSGVLPVIRTLGLDRLFEIHAGEVTMTGLILQGGARLTGADTGQTGGGVYVAVGASLTLDRSVVEASAAGTLGGGIYVEGTLDVVRSLVRNNFANGAGGGIAVWQTGLLTMTDSLVDDNEANAGGGGIIVYGMASIGGSTISNNRGLTVTALGAGLHVFAGATLSLTNSTVSGNVDVEAGGGIFNAGGVVASNVTIAGNIGAAAGGGILTEWPATFEARNSLIASNSGANGSDCYGTLTSYGFNLIQSVSDCSIVGDLGLMTFGPAGLEPLADNGGWTPTHALEPDSLAIDGGDPAGCRDGAGVLLLVDQRGAPRTMDGDADGTPRCDIGAFESGRLFSDAFEGGDLTAWSMFQP